MSNLCQELANFAVETTWEDLPASVVHETKFVLLDSIGCALAAISTDPGKVAIALARRLGGPPESSIIGVGGKVSCSSAAFANGQLINTLDYDAIMGGHAPPYIIPPPLAIAESTGASGKDLILATALGFEIAVRVARAIPFSSPIGKQAFRYPERYGFANCNFGAAAGVGKIFKFDQEKMSNALGIAGHLCQVLTLVRYSWSEHRHMTKYGVPGWQNTGGIMAALLAQMGYTGDTTVLDGEHGFFKFCGYEGWHPENVTEGIGNIWYFTTEVNYKPYPCCRVLHPALECFLSIVGQNNLKPEDIESVKAFCPQAVEAPCFSNRELTNIVDVQFGLPHLFAVAAHKVKVGVEWQDLDTVRDPKILEFSKKVSIQVHPETTKRPQFSMVEVAAKGKTFREERMYPRGAPVADLSMTDEELVEKFRHNASRILTRDKIVGVLKALLELETVENISEFMCWG